MRYGGLTSGFLWLRQVSYEEGKEFADSLGIKFIETSAKRSNNVEKAFFTIGTEIKNRVQKTDDSEVKKKDTRRLS